MRKHLNGQDIEMSAEEIAKFEEYQTQLQQQEIEISNQLQAKEDLKNSAKAKLIAGEPLTEAEANTLVI